MPDSDGTSLRPGDWREYIHTDPEILHGKPVIKGTRLSVRFVLARLAGGWIDEDLLQEYPSLTREGVRAALAYAADQLPDTPAKLAAR